MFDGVFDAFEFDGGSGFEHGVFVFGSRADDAEIGFEFGLGAGWTQGNPRVVGEIECEHILFWQVDDGFDRVVGEVADVGVEQVADTDDVDADDGVGRIAAQIGQDVRHGLFAAEAFVEFFCGVFEMNAEFDVDFIENIAHFAAVCLAVCGEFGEQDDRDNAVFVAGVTIGEAECFFVSEDEVLAAFDAFVGDVAHPFEAGEGFLEIDAQTLADRAGERT